MKTAPSKAKTIPKRRSPVRRNNSVSVARTKPKQIRQIVVAVDFSPCARAALRHAADLAELHRASLLLVSVVEPPRVFAEPYVQPYADWDKSVVSGVQTQLDELVTAEIPVPLSVTIKKEVTIGKASTKIVAAAEASHADLLVIGTHGYTGLKHFFLGSTAENVVRHAPCSVLVVHESDKRPWSRKPAAPSKILVPVDFSSPSKRAAEAALQWAAKLNAKVQLLHVISTQYPTGDFDPIVYQLLATDQSTSCSRQLTQWAKTLGDAAASIQHGRPATEIVRFAQQQKIGLIVIATRGQTGLKHLLLGSTTEEVVRRAHCPVLVSRW